MKIGNIKAKTLKAIVTAAKTLVDEAKFEFAEDGLMVNVVDKSHSAMANISVEPEGFTAYGLEEAVEIGVELHRLLNVLTVMPDDDEVSLLFQGGKFYLKTPLTTMSCANIDTTVMDKASMPNVDFDDLCEIRVEAAELLKSIRVVSKVPDCDLITFSLKDKVFEIKVKSDYEELIMKPEIEIKRSIDSVVTYDKSLLTELMKGMTDGEVTIRFRSDYPIIFQFLFAEDKGDISLLQAPRVEGEI